MFAGAGRIGRGRDWWNIEMGQDKKWLWIERAEIVVGIVIAIIVTYIELVQFLERSPASGNTPTIEHGVAAMSTALPSWLVFVVGGIGLALLATSWAMITLRLWAREHHREACHCAVCPTLCRSSNHGN